MPDTSAGADDVRASRCGPLRASSLVGTVSSGQNLVVARPSDLEMHKGERLSRARGFPGAQSEKQVNTVPLPICVSSHAKASFERENGGFSVEKTTRQRRGNPKLFAVFFRVIRATEILRARFFATTTDRPTIFYFFLRARYLNISTSALRRGGDYPRVACIYIQQPRQHSTGSITVRHNNEQTSIRPTRRRRGRQTIQQVTLSRARGATKVLLSRRAPRALKTNTANESAKAYFFGGGHGVFSPSSTWARTRPRRSRSPP